MHNFFSLCPTSTEDTIIYTNMTFPILRQFLMLTSTKRIQCLLWHYRERYGQESNINLRWHIASLVYWIRRGFYEGCTHKICEWVVCKQFFLLILLPRCVSHPLITRDGLEAVAGVSEDKLVECHGHFRSASCINCGSAHHADDCKSSMLEKGEAPSCKSCGGLVKPDIVFFGEVMPNRFADLVHYDVASSDLVIVLGTSLLVAPVASIPDWVQSNCHRLLLNRERVGSFHDEKPSDVFLEGNCDDSVRKLCQLAGWEEELDQLFSATNPKWKDDSSLIECPFGEQLILLISTTLNGHKTRLT